MKMERLWSEHLEETFHIGQIDLRSYSPLTLAYIGDGIFELVIRTVLVSRGNCQANKLHRRASAVVKATNQEQMIQYLLDEQMLTEEEQTVYRRGRNAYSPTRAKNASMTQYRKATGFEALMGYLYLNHQTERMIDLIKCALDGVKEEI